MNPVGELLRSDDIRLDSDIASKSQLLEELAAMLAARHGLSKPVILESLRVREQMGSTGVGHGFAIPHARMSQCVTATAALVRTKYAIPFDAPDGRPVSVFLGLIVPHKANEAHLQLLATAAGMFSDRGLRDQLRTGADPDALRETIAAWPDPPAASGTATA
jgi:nitrogen PTS system EIIA component